MKLKFASALIALAFGAMGVCNFANAQFADVKATFVLKGKAPEPAKLQGNDPVCGAFNMVSESLVVNKENNGIRYLALFPDAKSFDASKADPKVTAPIEKEPLLDNIECRFAPHLLVVKSGQTVTIKNSDKTGHNANFSFINNPPKNQQIPAGGQITMKVDAAEPAPIPVSCGSHSWMKSHVIVLDHPFVGTTNEKGELEIKGLPAGKINMKIWHESGKFKEVNVGGKALPVKRGAFEIELKPGMNDLGKIELDVADFKP